MAIKIVLIIVFIVAAAGFGIGGAVALYNRYDEDDKLSVGGLISVLLALLFVVLLIFVPGNIHQVNTGEVAVVRTMGKVTGYREPGIYWDFYMTHDYQMYDTKIQSMEIDTMSYSRDNQTIGVSINFQYQIQSDKIMEIATSIGTAEALESRLQPIVMNAIKTVLARNTAEEMIKDRSNVTSEIDRLVTRLVTESVGACNITVCNVLLTNIDFTDDFEAAVAAKVAQEQKKQQALIEQEQKLAEAENNKLIAIAEAEAKAEAAKKAAQAEADVAVMKATADMEVAKIAADSAEYQGRKDAAIALQKLASINGWTVVTYLDADGTSYNKLFKPDETLVTSAELELGVKHLIEVYQNEKWDGKLPVYQMGSTGTVAVVTTP